MRLIELKNGFALVDVLFKPQRETWVLRLGAAPEIDATVTSRKQAPGKKNASKTVAKERTAPKKTVQSTTSKARSSSNTPR